jgi:hypothetical protein
MVFFLLPLRYIGLYKFYLTHFPRDRNCVPVSVLLILAFCINCQELEAQLAAKEVSLPPEPSSDNDNAVNLLVKMPDGSRRGRRFLRSDKLQVNMPVTKYALCFPPLFSACLLN